MLVELTYACKMGCSHCMSDCKPDGGDIVYTGKKKYIVASSKNLGKQLKLADGSLLTTSKVTKIIHCGGWKTVTL